MNMNDYVLPMPPADGARYRCDFMISLKKFPFQERCDNTAVIRYRNGKDEIFMRCDEHNDLVDE